MRQARQRAKVSLTVLAKQFSYTKGYLSACETGHFEPPQALVAMYEQGLGLAAGALTLPITPHDAEDQSALEKHLKRQVMTEDSVFVTGASTVVGDVSTHDAMRLFGQVYARIYRVCAAMELPYDCPASLRNPRQELTDTDVDRHGDRNLIRRAGLVIAYIGQPSLVVGAHLAIAEEANRPILLLVEADRQAAADKLSRTIANVWGTVPFATPAKLDAQLAECLFRFFSQRNLDQAATAQRHRWTLADLEERKARLEAICEDLLIRGAPPRKPIAVDEWERTLQVR